MSHCFPSGEGYSLVNCSSFFCNYASLFVVSGKLLRGYCVVTCYKETLDKSLSSKQCTKI